jgi:SAM-dependent methyltransferase
MDTPERDGAVLGDSELQSETLEDLSSAVRYHNWLRALARPYLGDDPLEIGSGLGDYAQSYIEDGVPRVTVTEADLGRLRRLEARFAGRPEVPVRRLDLSDAADGHYSCVFAFNVLEHIPDHVAALQHAARLVRPGGAVVMFVPAFPVAMSRFDRRVGHVRRYTKRTLREAFLAARLHVEVLHYVNAPGLPAWILGMRLLRGTPRDGLLLRIWDSLVVRAARAVESRRHPPFGQSVFAVGLRPDSTDEP